MPSLNQKYTSWRRSLSLPPPCVPPNFDSSSAAPNGIQNKHSLAHLSSYFSTFAPPPITRHVTTLPRSAAPCPPPPDIALYPPAPPFKPTKLPIPATNHVLPGDSLYPPLFPTVPELHHLATTTPLPAPHVSEWKYLTSAPPSVVCPPSVSPVYQPSSSLPAIMRLTPDELRQCIGFRGIDDLQKILPIIAKPTIKLGPAPHVSE